MYVTNWLKLCYYTFGGTAILVGFGPIIFGLIAEASLFFQPGWHSATIQDIIITASKRVIMLLITGVLTFVLFYPFFVKNKRLFNKNFNKKVFKKISSMKGGVISNFKAAHTYYTLMEDKRLDRMELRAIKLEQVANSQEQLQTARNRLNKAKESSNTYYPWLQ